jgi:light-regulated signal transduction histidine kinase (bacteriophytochrome)
MSAPSDAKEYSDWTVIYDDQNEKNEDKLSDRRKTLARTLSIPKTMCILSDTKTEISTVAELPSPKLKLPQLGDESTERVFPVRSVVSFDSTQSSALPTPSIDKLETPISPFSDTWTGGLGDEDGCRQKNGSSRGFNMDSSASKTHEFSARVRQKRESESDTASVPKEQPTPGQGFSRETPGGKGYVLANLQETMRNGSDVLGTHKRTKEIQFSHEDEEDIFIQSFGALLVVTESDGNLEIQIASSNSKDIIGYSPDELFDMQSLCYVLLPSQRRIFINHCNSVLSNQYDVEASGPDVFSFSILSPTGVTQYHWCIMHTSNIHKNYIICEIQPETFPVHLDENINKLARSESEQLDSTSGAYFKSLKPPDTNDSNTPNPSELLNTVPRILRQLTSSQTLEALVQDTMTILQEVVRFDRTSIYHFDSDRNGIVVADASSSAEFISHEGVHFQGSAFPETAKAQYTRNIVSFSYSGTHDKASLVYRASPNKLLLDMAHTYLSVAPTPSKPHAENPVRACLSIQISVCGKLWGLISCQSYTSNQGLHPLNQKLCWFISEAVSSNIKRLSYSLPFQLRESNVSPNDADKVAAIKTPPGDLLSLFEADYAVASILDETKILGKPIDSQEVLALLEYMKSKENDTPLWSTDVASDFQDLNYPPGFHHLAGLLYIPLSRDGHDFIIFFRADSGDFNPEEIPQNPANHEAEKSSRQQLWSTAEFGKASILSLLYRTFTDLWQEKEVTMQNNQLMRLLLANSAHEFRTPLNAIINYLEIALDGPLDRETRHNISRSHSASKSLVYIINDLLDLTNTENGQRLIKDEVFNLSETLTEATDIFWEEARQKYVDLQVVQHAALPPVLGDQRRVRQVITNLISNAVQHTSSGAVTIESCVVPESLDSNQISVEVAIHDTGSGMSQETVEILFCELEQVSNKGYMQNPKSYEQSNGQFLDTEGVLGLGLALVARIVRNMNGQLSLKSEAGKGSCFKIRLKFPLPEEDCGQRQSPLAASDESLKIDETRRKNASLCAPGQNKNGIPCECGESPEFSSGEPVVNIDVSLKSGMTKNLCLRGNELEKSNLLDESDPSIATKHSPSKATQTPSKRRSSSTIATKETQDQTSVSPTMNWNLHVLVAEDDPINSTIVRKRLERLGHTVHLTANGKECATIYNQNPTRFDAVLMDLQVSRYVFPQNIPT